MRGVDELRAPSSGAETRRPSAGIQGRVIRRCAALALRAQEARLRGLICQRRPERLKMAWRRRSARWATA